MAAADIVRLAGYLADVKFLGHLTRNEGEMESTMVRVGLLRRMIEDIERLHAEPKPPFQQTAASYDKMWDTDIRAHFSHVDAVVEATNDERHSLWHEYHYHPIKGGRKVTWEPAGCGILPCVGRFGPDHEFEVYANLQVDVVDGHNILFYYATSRYVDHDLVREFIKDIVPERAWSHHTDATNFFNAINGAARDKETAS